MKTRIAPLTAELTDHQLLARLQQLARADHGTAAALVGHLAELDARKLYLGEGCASAFVYCIEVLKFSEHAAYERIKAARAARNFPVVLEWLASGRVNLTTVRLLAPHFTLANHVELLTRAEGLRRRKVEELVAAVRPLPPVPTVVRKLPTARTLGSSRSAAGVEPGEPPLLAVSSGPSSSSNSDLASASAPASAPAAASASGFTAASAPDSARSPSLTPAGALSATSSRALPAIEASAAPRAVVTPLAPDRYKIQFTANATSHANLLRAQELLRHQIPNGDPAAVFERALALLVKTLEKQKFGGRERPKRVPRVIGVEAVDNAPAAGAAVTTDPACEGRARGAATGEPSSGDADAVAGGATDAGAPGSRVRTRGTRSRYVPVHVRRNAWLRDAERCGFTTPDGRRCSERGEIEFHHVVPHGDRGEPTLGNIELRCRAHNRYEADLYFGPGTSEIREHEGVYRLRTPERHALG